MADPDVSHVVLPAGSHPRGVVRWGYFLVLNGIALAIASAIFVGVLYADALDPYLRGTYEWLLANPAVTSVMAFSPLACSLLVGWGYAQRARRRKAAALAALSSLAVVFALSSVRAADRAGDVVAKVGAVNLTVAEVEQRLRAVPDFQLATFGKTPREMTKNFVEQVMVRDVLLAEGAKAHHLEDSVETKAQVDSVLRRARISALRAGLTVSIDDIAQFYAQNRARFDTPERIGVFRVLCKTEEEAKDVLAIAKGSSGLARWNELAREKSIDNATRYRGGNLGFLASDGSSTEVSVKTDPVLFAAAKAVKDGELVPEPVREGQAFAAVWRRASTPAVHRTMEEEASAISQILMRDKLETALRDLLKTLRSERHVQSTPELVEAIEVDPMAGVSAKKRAGDAGVAPKKPELSAAPSATPRGLR